MVRLFATLPLVSEGFTPQYGLLLVVSATTSVLIKRPVKEF